MKIKKTFITTMTADQKIKLEACKTVSEKETFIRELMIISLTLMID